MLDTHLMIRTDDRTLKQAPDALNAVSMNIANNPFLGGVINPLVFRVGILNSPIRWHFVGVDRFRVRRGVVVDELVQHGLGRVRDDLQSNHAVALNGSNSDSLVALVTASHARAPFRRRRFHPLQQPLAEARC